MVDTGYEQFKGIRRMKVEVHDGGSNVHSREEGDL